MPKRTATNSGGGSETREKAATPWAPKPKRKPPPHAFKPGNKWAWKPGESGNPAGRSAAKRAAEELLVDEVLRRWPALVRSLLDQAIGHTEDMSPQEIAVRQQAVATGLQKTSTAVAQMLVERVLGKISTPVEVASKVATWQAPTLDALLEAAAHDPILESLGVKAIPPPVKEPSK